VGVSLISALSMPWSEIDVMPRLLWAELALDDDQRHALARKLAGVGVWRGCCGAKRRCPPARIAVQCRS
jgi:hypothetical protein